MGRTPVGAFTGGLPALIVPAIAGILTYTATWDDTQHEGTDDKDKTDRKPRRSAQFLLGWTLSWYLAVYGGLYALFYMKKSHIAFKFNKAFPDSSMVRAEMFRTLRSCVIAWAMDLYIRRAYREGKLSNKPWKLGKQWYRTVLMFLVGHMWADFHFYATHRFLHLPFFWKHIHSVHHLSWNPEPWAGLSMHPVEAFIYFTSMLMPLLFPVHPAMYCLLKVGLDLTPAFGHLGVGGGTGGSRFHWLHHVRRHYNYGASDNFDRLFGTFTAHLRDK